MGTTSRLAVKMWLSNQIRKGFFLATISDESRFQTKVDLYAKVFKMAPQSPDAQENSKRDRYLTMDEVRQHNSQDDCWVVIEDGVYNVTKWMKSHPGGALPILYMAGHDCTDVFKAFHPMWVEKKKLPYFRIGNVREITGPKRRSGLSQDLEKLREDLVREGFLDTNCECFCFSL